MKTILCYGDSNTWGFVPTQPGTVIQRYPKNIRWPGRLQEHLGKNYYIIEEGLNGRATNIDHPIPPDRNGARYLPPCLYSHAPIDLVILSLGGNDLKTYFQRDLTTIIDGIRELVTIIQSSSYGHDLQSPPQVLLLSHLIPLKIAETLKDDMGCVLFENMVERATKLIPMVETLASEVGCHYYDISNEIKPSFIDGIHLDEDGHRKSAKLIAEKIASMKL